ncbi:MAG: glycosyltransferase family 2 protein [Clostridia bacterium]|nr:glycosyltransferase family 2 protein [Clostridia bacterium]
MSVPKVSVIIPVYNSEKYLEKCLGSIAAQTFTDFEAIMVDDGSTDGSALVCKNFAENDHRFKYYYKENGGAASARNYGIKQAAGDYIAFIDSDDYIEPDCFKNLTALLDEQSFSIIQGGMKLIRNGKESLLLPGMNNAKLSGDEYKLAVLKRQIPIFLFQSTVSKLYKRELIENSGVCFNEKYSISEDCLFNTELLKSDIDSVCFNETSDYCYIQDNSTLSKSSVSGKKVQNAIEIGTTTAAIRNSLISDLCAQNDSDVIAGFSKAICIIYLSNAHLIETGGFSEKEKAEFYNSYFSVMDYPVLPALSEYEGTDRKIIEASFKKDYKAISRIYALREKKAIIRKLLHRG